LASGLAPEPLRPDPEAAGSAEVPSLCSDLVTTARAASGARVACLWRVQPGEARARAVARSTVGGAAARESLQLVRRFAPEFDPGALEIPLDANPLLEGLAAGGEPVTAPLGDLAAGALDARVLRVAASVGGMRYGYACGVVAGGRVWGALSFCFAQRPSPARQRVCASFARQLTLAVETEGLCAALREEARQLQGSRAMLLAAEDRLREDIAEQLHGRVQSRLIVAWHRLDECGRRMSGDPSGALALLEQVRADLLDIQERDVRQASRRLHPAVIRLGLLTALGTLVEEFAGQLAVTVRVDPELRAFEDGGGTFPAPCALAVYRAVEEGLGNAARHGRARHAELDLDLVAQRRRIRATVRDDGRGLDPDAVRAGLGLAAIAGRVEQAGGTWSLTGQPGRGTTLAVEVPVPLPLRPRVPGKGSRLATVTGGA
jgi:signal transduction histidine kinase